MGEAKTSGRTWSRRILGKAGLVAASIGGVILTAAEMIYLPGTAFAPVGPILVITTFCATGIVFFAGVSPDCSTDECETRDVERKESLRLQENVKDKETARVEEQAPLGTSLRGHETQHIGIRQKIRNII